MHAAGELSRQVLELTGGVGADQALVCAGVADALTQAIRATATGGTVVVTALVPRSVDHLAIAPIELQRGQKTLIGSAFGSISQRVAIPEVLAHYTSERLKISDASSTRSNETWRSTRSAPPRRR